MSEEMESTFYKEEEEIIPEMLLQLATILCEENVIDEREKQKMKLLICNGKCDGRFETVHCNRKKKLE